MSLALFAAGAARADEPLANVELVCAQLDAPGRVVCELGIDAIAGRLAWADLLVRRSPDFAKPLRSRVGPRQGKREGDRRVVLPLALVAKDIGRGKLVVDARFVICVPPDIDADEDERCSSGVLAAAAEVVVGAGAGE